MKNLNCLFALILLCVSISLPLSAADIPDYIQAAIDNPQRSDEDRKRDLTSKPADVLSFFGVTPDMKVLDYLSGGGYYSEILAGVVADKGEITAHTNVGYAQFVGEEVEKRFVNNRLPTVKRLTSEVQEDMRLGENSFDMILMFMTYHDIYYVADYWSPVDRDDFFKQIRNALKPGGVLAIIDHSAVAGSGSQHAQDLHRIDEAFAKKDIISAGFTHEASSDLLRHPEDDRSKLVFADDIRRKTDRFIHRYVKK